MRKDQNNWKCLMAAAIFLGILFSSFTLVNAEVTSAFLYHLSSFSGKIPYDHMRLYFDRLHNEMYVASSDTVWIFNESGMEVGRFGDDPNLGAIYDLSVSPEGDIFLLSYNFLQIGSGIPNYSILRCNYRGELKERINVSSFPPVYPAFSPNRMFYRNGRFYLISMGQMRAIVIDKNGAFERDYDFAGMIGLEEKDRPGNEIFGIDIDKEGNFLFSVPVQFRIFKISPKGEVTSFGKVGGAPGMFGIVSGVAADDRGNIFVADALRCVVMVFDRSFRFLTEFGYRGNKPENLVSPMDLRLGNIERLYVTQGAKRGVSVFSVAFN